jgi:hypothetical protein
MASAPDLTKMVPGFDFLQGLMKGAGAGLPSIGQWIAPTLDPDELAKRIGELRTVQFWLEQNAKLLGTTIQALEVQRMTLATLRGMNLPMADLGDALKAAVPSRSAPVTEPEPEPEPAPSPAAGPVAAKPTATARRGSSARAATAPGARAAASPAAAVPGIDPMQWWGSLTRQFTELATGAMKDAGGDLARQAAGSLLRGTVDAAGQAIQRAAAAPVRAAGKAARVAIGRR